MIRGLANTQFYRSHGNHVIGSHLWHEKAWGTSYVKKASKEPAKNSLLEGWGEGEGRRERKKEADCPSPEGGGGRGGGEKFLSLCLQKGSRKGRSREKPAKSTLLLKGRRGAG